MVACAVWLGYCGYLILAVSNDQTPVQERSPSYLCNISLTLPASLTLNSIVEQRFENPGYTLGCLLPSAQHCQTSDPKDRFYALLGLSTTPDVELHPSIRPDYSRSARDCMRDATRYIIAESRRLNVLADIRLNAPTHDYHEPNTPPWPSWVPVWCCDGLNVFISYLETETYAADNGCLLAQSLAFDDVDKDVLRLKGHTVDAVADVISLNEEMFASIESLQNLLQLTDLAPHKPPLSLAELALILSVGAIDSTRVGLEDSRIDSFKVMAESLETSSTVPDQVRYDVTVILESLIYLCRGKVLFITEHSRLGVGLASVQVGDNINVLYGGQWPFALRNQGGEYRLIGVCYVHGIMDGEAVKDCQKRGEEPVVFKIR